MVMPSQSTLSLSLSLSLSCHRMILDYRNSTNFLKMNTSRRKLIFVMTVVIIVTQLGRVECFQSAGAMSMRRSPSMTVGVPPSTFKTPNGMSKFHGASSTSILFRSNERLTRTSLNMVLTTPESVIEQASTKILLDDLISESYRTIARKPIMMQFDPSAGWIWRRWQGTVFSETWRSCVNNMIYAVIVSVLYKLLPTLMAHLTGFNVLWGQLLSVTTFTLTFFLNQSYALWRTCYGLSRRLQGRLNDLSMTLAAHAQRTDTVDPKKLSTYTEPARQVLELMGRYIRVFNILTYASFTGSHRPILTPQGMRRLVDRGLLTEKERQILSDSQLPVTQRHVALLLWIMRLFVDARRSGHILGGDGFEQEFLEKCHVIRAQYGSMTDELQGRMPLAYAHIVQILVDCILWMYPFMAQASGMSIFLGALGTGLLTMFYQGLFDLAKQFLDPYDNENYGKGEDPLCIDTLIAETNAGSVRWLNGLEKCPFSYDKVARGDMTEYQLPRRGWTIEEVREREEKEQLERERLEMLEEARIASELEEIKGHRDMSKPYSGGDDKINGFT